MAVYGIGRAGLLLFAGLGIIPVILGGLAAGAGGDLGWRFLDVDGIIIRLSKKFVS